MRTQSARRTRSAPLVVITTRHSSNRHSNCQRPERRFAMKSNNLRNRIGRILLALSFLVSIGLVSSTAVQAQWNRDRDRDNRRDQNRDYRRDRRDRDGDYDRDRDYRRNDQYGRND